ncbi:MAG: cyclomaltodextrin glucanotransferase [Deltaproteobacteria bacterium]|nr:cyclomaltodextrin glucanotransferase [Deltaproteobacteria bacterium]
MDVRANAIYFVVTDRFHNSDPRNDRGRDPGSYDPTRTDWGKYWGGDLGGVIDKLDYVRDLGATAIWITPVFAQAGAAADAEGRGHAAYHGYWARDFRRLDEHLVADPADVHVFRRSDTVFDRLLAEMKRRNMTLVLDVVCNHSSPELGRHKGELYDDGEFLTSYEDDRLGWYHRAGGISDWRCESTVQQGELCGLADFNENVHSFRRYIKQVMHDWVGKGVGALRVDTVKHMPLWFWQEWVSDLRADHPHLFLVGEWFQGGCWDPASVEFANRSGMTIFDFSLQRALEDCLARSQYEGFQAVQGVIERDASFSRATHLVTFVDNHDMPRFLSVGATPARLRMAINLILVGRGIPCLYYGDEQLLHDDTNGGADPYNRPMMTSWDGDAPIARDVRALSRVRRENPAVQRGYHQARWLSPDTYVFERAWGGSVCLAAFNRGAARAVGPITTTLPDGEHACVLTGRTVRVENGRIVELALGVDDSLVLSHVVAEAPARGTRLTFQLNGYATSFGERVAVVGSCPELGEWDAAKAPLLRYVNANLWEGDVDFPSSAGGLVRYRYVMLKDGADPIFESVRPRRTWIPPAGVETRLDRWGG